MTNPTASLFRARLAAPNIDPPKKYTASPCKYCPTPARHTGLHYTKTPRGWGGRQTHPLCEDHAQSYLSFYRRITPMHSWTAWTQTLAEYTAAVEVETNHRAQQAWEM